MRFILVLVICLISNISFSQVIGFNDCTAQDTSASHRDLVFYKAETMPRYNGLRDSIGSIIEDSISSSGEGTLTIRLIISRYGSACLAEVENNQNISIDLGLLRQRIGQLNNWKPATQNNFVVRCFVSLDIKVKNGKAKEIIYTNDQ